MTPEEQIAAYDAAYKDIQTAVQGVDVTVAIKALLDMASLLIAVAAKDQPFAFSLIDTLPQLMKQAVLAEWDKAREMRARGQTFGKPVSDTVN